MIKTFKVVGNIYGAGVYCIKSMDGKILYIGSSWDMADAKQRHDHYLARNQYMFTKKGKLMKKSVLQFEYNEKGLIFEVLIDGNGMCDSELGELEQSLIKQYKNLICNTQKSVTRHSSNGNTISTYRRKKSNLGNNNPNCKIKDTRIISEIIWLKMNGYKPREIAKFYDDIKANYISLIGVTRWIHIMPIKPEFITVEKIS